MKNQFRNFRLSENRSLPWSLSFLKFSNKKGYCAAPYILGELIQNFERKVIVQIMEAVGQTPDELLDDELLLEQLTPDFSVDK